MEKENHSVTEERPVIRLLPDTVVNQIAAGEVIERPVAAVKELIENALDAGATRVEVEFRNGGKSYIRVEDNGSGMSPDQALLSLERHATSKLREVHDLERITSLGFRGEALPSIASVSRFTLKTRTADWEHGTEVFINGGKLIHQRECGMAPGTRIEVAHLFNSVPARRKFLKTDNTEAAHIVHLVRLHAVARPDVSFQLIENGRIVFQSPACPSMQDRVAEIWGRSLSAELLELPEATSTDGFRLHGLIGKPGIGRSTRRDMIAMVNGRPVDSRTLNFALTEAYHTFIPKGRYPVAFLFFEISPAAVDVNVHPAKREVRFRDEGKVRQFILRNVQNRLQATGGQSYGSPAPEASNVPVAKSVEPNEAEWAAAKSARLPAPANDSAARAAEALEQKRHPQAAPNAAPAPLAKAPLQPSSNALPRPAIRPPSAPQASPAAKPVIEENTHQHVDWRYLGRMQEAYALFSTEQGLVLFDFRAAHARIMFERIETAFAERIGGSQRLLFPVPMEFEPVTSRLVEEHLDFFREHGFEMAPFGRCFYRLESHPDWLPESQAEAFIRDLLGQMREGRLKPEANRVTYDELAKLALKRTVRLSDSPNDNELIQLVRQLFLCKQPLTCPAGRPTFIEWARRDIDKRFGK